MTAREFSYDLEGRLKEKLSTIDLHKGDVSELSAGLLFSKAILQELKSFIARYSFADQSEEISFFKILKPALFSKHIYLKRVLSIRLRTLPLDNEDRLSHFKKVLHKYQSFVRSNESFYAYMLCGNTDLDIRYFTRNPSIALNKDDRFCTSHDAKSAEILAGEMFKSFLIAEIGRSQLGDDPSTLTWTASKTDLTELIYALQSCGVFNGGSSDIRSIASAFERLFNVDIGDYYRTFQSIQLRKKGQTVFLDRLRDSLENKLEQ